MDASRKTIQSLTVSLDEKREELSLFYLQFGGKLFKDSSDSTNATGALSPERVDNWLSLMAARETDTRSILDIKSAIERQQELTRFRKEIDKNLFETNTAYRTRLEDLGRSFYGQYTDADAEYFGDAYERASVAGKHLIELEEKQEKLRVELEASGFFGKVVAQLKMAGISSNIRQQKVKVMKILSDGAANLLERGVLENRQATGSLDESVESTFEAARATEKQLEDLKTRAETLETDLAFVKSSLENLGASENPLRRLDELRARVKDSDKRIDSLTVLSAREYCDKFLNDDGMSVLGNAADGHTFSDMGAYSHNLETAAALRSEISVIRRKIEVLETTVKIESLDRNILSYQRSVADYERRIQHYRDLSASMAVTIRESGEERQRLSEHRDSIEKTLL